MSLVPAFEIGIWNAWTFTIIYPLQWLVVVIMSRQTATRTDDPAELKQNRRYRFLSSATMITWVVASLYSIFLPLCIGTAWFYTGLTAALLGIITVTLATANVYRTPADTPFTTGAYRFSRHPMYLSMIMVYLGVSIAAASWLFLLITITTFFLLRYGMIQEEKFCAEKFGHEYRNYIGKTPRWLGLPRKL